MGKYEAILKIVQYGNLTRAAQELGYVQSNLSHMIQRLENDLQIKIFHRDRQGVTLTRAGQELVDIMYKIETLEASLHSVALAQRTSTLRIGTFTSVSIHWIPEILEKFFEIYPSTSVFLTEFDSYINMDSAVRNNEVDCTFYAGNYHAGLDFFPLCRDPYFAVVHKNHPLASQKSTNIQEISQYPFLMPGDELNCPIKEVTKLFHLPPRLITKTQEDMAILPLIERNLGVSILPDLAVLSTNTQICTIPLEENLAREIGILCKPYGEISEVTKCFIQTARDFIHAHETEKK